MYIAMLWSDPTAWFASDFIVPPKNFISKFWSGFLEIPRGKAKRDESLLSGRSGESTS